MAESDRVAGIYSEIQYRFDPKSIKNLRKFKRDLMEVKNNLREIKRLSKGNVKMGFNSKQAKVSRQVQQATQKTAKATSSEVERSAKVWRMKEKILKNQVRENRLKQRGAQIAANAQKKEMAMEAKMAAQRSKMGRMGGMAMDRGKITPASLNRIRQAQERLNRAYKDGSISVSQFNTQSQRLTGILQRQSSVVRKNTMSFNQMRTAIAGATGAYSAFAGAAGIKNIGGAFEDAQIMLETALGAEEAADTMGFLIEQSQRLGVGATESAKGFARFSLAGKQLGFTTQELQEQFLGVAEAATVFGLRQEEITGTIRALEQIMSKNQVMAEELKLQLGDRLPAAMTIAAKSMNMSMRDFTKAMENGEISAREFMPVFTKAMQEMAEPGLEKAFKTMNVAWKKMTQNFKLFVKALFESGVGELFTQIFNTLSDVFTMAAPLISLLGAFASTILKVLVYPIRVAIAAIRDLFVFIDWKLKEIFGTGLNELMSKIGTVAGYITSIFAGVGRFLDRLLSPFIKVFQTIFGKSGIAQVGKATHAAMPPKMQGMISEYGKPIKAGASKAAEIGGNVMRSRYTTASGAVTGAQEAQQYIMQETRVEFTGEARDALRENKRESTSRKITNNSRG